MLTSLPIMRSVSDLLLKIIIKFGIFFPPSHGINLPNLDISVPLWTRNPFHIYLKVMDLYVIWFKEKRLAKSVRS